ncbi:hypothetical protein H6H01_13940 [Nostoc calcicola FACHB-3891]|nr:hypothetical protein [Nostoc calcicola FACHB-3891]
MGWASRPPVERGGQDVHPTGVDNLFVGNPLFTQCINGNKQQKVICEELSVISDLVFLEVRVPHLKRWNALRWIGIPISNLANLISMPLYQLKNEKRHQSSSLGGDCVMI